MSGAVDFSILNRTDPSSWSVEKLVASGLSRAEALSRGRTLSTPYTALPLPDPRYPAQMARIPYAPPVLFCEGNLALLKEPGVALVGSRRCTASGAAIARELAAAVVEAGAVVVSGMAYGIDTAVHLTASGRTIAVLGQGLEVKCTAAQQRTRSRILSSGGLLVSEFPPTFPASRYTFPRRNRVIAWLAKATVIIEATATSGALHTARAALCAGMPVLAVPGHPHVPTAAGCLALIDQGAEIVRSGAELRQKLALVRPGLPQDPLLLALRASPTFDELLYQTGIVAPQLARKLALLELTGQVERLPGDRYALRTS